MFSDLKKGFQVHTLDTNTVPKYELGKEIVICAAIWVQDGKKRPHQPTNIPSGAVFCGLRHCSIISQFAAYGIAHKNRSVQGFLTSKNRFLTREEASELVKNNNQEMVVDRNAIREQLYSEDLY